MTAPGVSEIFVKGKWIQVPSLDWGAHTVVIRGRWLRTAIVRAEEFLETELEDPEGCIATLRSQRTPGLRADILTFAQKPPATVPRYSYPTEWQSVAAVHVTRFTDWWQALPQATRKNVRRSEKRGVVTTVREFDEELVRGVVELNNDSPLRQGRRNVQYRKAPDEVRKDHASFLERSDFICAHVEGELIGFLKLVYRGDVASIMNLLSKASHYDKRPSNVLVAKAIELCESRGVSCLTYGQLNYGNKRESPLKEFKIRNGFGEILVPRYYVPLTTWGGMCFRAGFHRGLIGILPQSAITVLVGARAKWYNLRHSVSPELPV